MINSAGLVRQTPKFTISRPFIISSWVIVSPNPHLTKYASLGVDPANAPCLQRLFKKFSIIHCIRTQVLASLGSKTKFKQAFLQDCSILIIVLLDRKSTRLNSSHVKISYAVFCLKKKNI